MTVNVSGDAAVELFETFQVTLSGATGGATITTANAAGAIQNDDTGFAIAASSANKAEGNAGTTPYVFTVTRSGNLASSSRLNFAVAGSGANPANAADFGGTLPSGSVSFAANETAKVITINVSGDTAVEPDETFSVTLSFPPSSATITAPSATGTIRNDDTSLAIAATSANKAEGNAGSNPFTFTVTRAGRVTGATTVNFAVTGTGANPANVADFAGGVLPSGTVTFNANETSKLITVNVAGDSSVEPNENFRVTLSGASGGAIIVTAAANGTIINDDITFGQLPLACSALHVGDNTCTISGATPGGLVRLAIGTQAGTTSLPTLGVTLGIQDAALVGDGIADANGLATIPFNIASSFDNQSILVQGLQQTPLAQVSNIVSQTVTLRPTLTAAEGTGPTASASGLQTEDVEPILKQALAFWTASGLTAPELQLLQQVTVQVTDLAESGLGQNVGTTIFVDANAADFGWFVDTTPDATEEFVRRRTNPGQPFSRRELFARENGPADQRMDLLTVVLHEIGNVLGRQSSDTAPIPLMDPTLSAGVRKLPPLVVDAIFAQL